MTQFVSQFVSYLGKKIYFFPRAQCYALRDVFFIFSVGSKPPLPCGDFNDVSMVIPAQGLSAQEKQGEELGKSAEMCRSREQFYSFFPTQ